jgi:hypothetical protein
MHFALKKAHNPKPDDKGKTVFCASNWNVGLYCRWPFKVAEKLFAFCILKNAYNPKPNYDYGEYFVSPCPEAQFSCKFRC